MTKEMRINPFLDAGLFSVSADDLPNPAGSELVVPVSFEEVMAQRPQEPVLLL